MRLSWFAAGTALLLVCLVAPAPAMATPSSAAPTSAAPPMLYDAQLADVSCPAAAFCLAAGSVRRQSASNAPVRPLLEKWDGAAWQTLLAPHTASGQGELTSIDCRSNHFCVATGIAFGAGGHSSGLFAAVWNGTTWDVTKFGHDNISGAGLASVSCGTARSCLVVGWYDPRHGVAAPLALRWNGNTWTRTTNPPTPSGTARFQSVSCTAADRCVAVGDWTQRDVGRRPLAEVWNGKTWTLTKLPNPDHTDHDPGEATSLLEGVSCTAPRKCVAVGIVGDADVSKPLVERWNGSSWTRIRPEPVGSGKAGEFAGVTCLSATRCQTVGTVSVTAFTYRPLAQRWQHGAWATQPTQARSTTTLTLLGAVSCITATNCWSVGNEDLRENENRFHTVAEHWDGHAWTIVATP